MPTRAQRSHARQRVVGSGCASSRLAASCPHPHPHPSPNPHPNPNPHPDQVRLELLGSLVLGACACLAVASPLHESPGEREDSEKAGLAGLALSFAITITNSLAMLVQQATTPT
eukprot:scaffold58740_cov51-Phaeocystis_antarctica.AAC.1